MARGYQIPGECLVVVKFGQHIQPGSIPGATSVTSPGYLYQLGLAENGIQIMPGVGHRNVNLDSYSQKVPADLLTDLPEAVINMNLINFDLYVLDTCLRESMGGGVGTAGASIVGAGYPLGGNVPTFASGNHFVSLGIIPAQMPGYPWRFPSACLAGEPTETFPAGTRRSTVKCIWRAIPYKPEQFNTITISGQISFISPGEIVSSGAVLYDHTYDT